LNSISSCALRTLVSTGEIIFTDGIFFTLTVKTTSAVSKNAFITNLPEVSDTKLKESPFLSDTESLTGISKKITRTKSG